MTRLAPADIEAIERATLAAVAPQAIEALADVGWLLPFDDGTVGRARSAVPLHHGAPAADPDELIARIEARYAAHGLPTALRLPEVPIYEALRAALELRGYRGGKPTLTQIGSVRAMRAVSAGTPAQVDTAPDEGWASVFLGAGFDPVDGASRVRALRRASGNLYASVREDGRTVAAGAASFGHGWASVHGMRTEQSARGRGLAGRVLAGLAQAALARGFDQVFLQVEAGNDAARALYRRAGFETAWQYGYWQRPGPA
jgi:ribosomal protein S18 acetylase RimI-like enzyme